MNDATIIVTSWVVGLLVGAIISATQIVLTAIRG